MRSRLLLVRRCSLPAAVVLLGAACGPPPAPPAPPLDADDFVLGGVPATADTTEIRLSFGAPDSVTMAESPFEVDAPLTTWHYDGFEVRFGTAGTPLGYLVVLPGEGTARGARVGDSAARVLHLYGEPDSRADGSWTYVETDADGALHIVDFLMAADTVARIYIGRATN